MFLISSSIKRKKGSMEKGITLGLGQVIYMMSILQWQKVGKCSKKNSHYLNEEMKGKGVNWQSSKQPKLKHFE